MKLTFYEKNLTTLTDDTASREWTFCETFVYCKRLDTRTETLIKPAWVDELKQMLQIEKKQLNTLLKNKKLDDKRRKRYRKELREYRRQLTVLNKGTIAGQLDYSERNNNDIQTEVHDELLLPEDSSDLTAEYKEDEASNPKPTQSGQSN